MRTVQRRTACASVALAGIAAGLLLIGTGRMTDSLGAALLVGAPFALAALTGVAKSSTP